MLTEVIMHDCIVKLLKNHDAESLECLCRLLSTIGKDLDFEKAKVRNRHTHTWSVCGSRWTHQAVVVLSPAWTSTSIRWKGS